MAAYAGTHVVVADAYQTDGVSCVGRQTAGVDPVGQMATVNILERDGQVLVDQFIHAPLYLAFILAVRLMIQVEAHLAFLPFDMGITAALTAEEANHRLVEQVLGGMCRWELLLVVLVEQIVIHWIMILILYSL